MIDYILLKYNFIILVKTISFISRGNKERVKIVHYAEKKFERSSSQKSS